MVIRGFLKSFSLLGEYLSHIYSWLCFCLNMKAVFLLYYNTFFGRKGTTLNFISCNAYLAKNIIDAL